MDACLGAKIKRLRVFSFNACLWNLNQKIWVSAADFPIDSALSKVNVNTLNIVLEFGIHITINRITYVSIKWYIVWYDGKSQTYECVLILIELWDLLLCYGSYVAEKVFGFCFFVSWVRPLNEDFLILW